MSTLNDYFTIQDAAKELGVSDSRIRQLCIEHEIGTKVGQYRFLTKNDLQQLKEIPRKIGRPKSA